MTTTDQIIKYDGINIRDIYERKGTKIQFWVKRKLCRKTVTGVVCEFDLERLNSMGGGVYSLSMEELERDFTKQIYMHTPPANTIQADNGGLEDFGHGVHSVNVTINVNDGPKKIPVPKILESWYAESMKYKNVKQEAD